MSGEESDSWQRVESDQYYTVTTFNTTTGEIKMRHDDGTLEIDCETFRAIYLELERKGMYDG